MIKIIRPVFNTLYCPKVQGLENINCETGFILAGNHKSLLDIPLVATAIERNVHFMGKKELFENSICNYIFSKLGSFPVDREGIDLNAIKTSIKLLREDEILGIFPEGTRNKTNELLLPFKIGTVKMAKETNATIVPFVITGKYKFWNNNLKVTFLKPFKVNNMSLDEANNKLRKMMLKELKKSRN